MKTAQFHRAYWNYETNTGIGKLHYQPLGILAFVFEDGEPQYDTNFLDADEIAYYRKNYKKHGRILTIGVQFDRDIDLVRVTENENIYTFCELNLEVKTEGENRFFRRLDGEWQEIENSPVVEYQRCDSLICVS
ncbi:hypothetical protein CEN49_22915 [Fischerella thermalis CCMEE 5273]|jgi:hypothetical protein|nr:hypothetical protein CEN49_22915 [Fischerella thermalis CCMEE 5273]